MATVIKPRTAIIIALTVTAVAVSSFVLLPRWRASKVSRAQHKLFTSRAESSEGSKSDENVIEAAQDDRVAVWKPPALPRRDRHPGPEPEARKETRLLLTPNSLRSKHKFLETREAAVDLRGDLGDLQRLRIHNSGKNDAQNVLQAKPRVSSAILKKVAIADHKAAPIQLTTTSTTTSPVSFKFTDSSSNTSFMNKLPLMTRGSVKIRPERIPPPAHSSDIYISLLTATKFHETRISLLYLTWLQTINPVQVS